jgi:choline dehydrogenase-like flavoprotein
VDANLTTDADLVSHLSKRGEYDFIVVGSGIGGGTLAQQPAAAEKRALVIETGGLEFSTHCLNTSRPHWQAGSVAGPSQDNDIVFNTVKNKVQTAKGSDTYVGGPVYCLGGRSTVRGLYAPRIDQDTLKKYFPKRLTQYLDDTGGGGYSSAFKLMSNSSQKKPDVYPTSVAKK